MRPLLSLLLWQVLLDFLSIGLGAPRSAEVEGISKGRSIGDLSHGLEGLLDEGDGSELGWEDQQSEAWSTKLGRKVGEVVGDWLKGGVGARRNIWRADDASDREKQRESPVSWWQKINRPDNKDSEANSEVDILTGEIADERRDKKKVFLPTLSEVVTLFDQFYPYVTQYPWKVKEDTVKKVFLKILQDISRSNERSNAMVDQIIKNNILLYTKPMTELRIDPYLQRKYNFLIKDLFDAKKTLPGLEDETIKEDFDKDMLNNMKAMYAHPRERPSGNFETLKNSYFYPQMFNKLDGSMWKYEDEPIPSSKLEAKTERSLANDTGDMVTEESAPEDQMVGLFANLATPHQLSRSGLLDTSIPEEPQTEEVIEPAEVVEIVREHGLNMEQLQLEPPPLVNSLVSPFLVRGGWEKTQVRNPSTSISTMPEVLLSSEPEYDQDKHHGSLGYLLGFEGDPEDKSPSFVYHQSADQVEDTGRVSPILNPEGTETMLVMLPESSTHLKEAEIEHSTSDAKFDNSEDMNEENHTILGILEELILDKYLEMKEEGGSEEVRDMSMKKLIHLLHLLLLLKNKESGMESLENSWEGPTAGMEDDHLHKFKLVGDPHIVPPSTKYGVLVGNALTRPPESSHLFEDSTRRDAQLVHQDSLSFPGDDSLTGGHGGSSVPLFVASLPASVRSQLASWGYSAPTGRPQHHADREQEEYSKEMSHLGEILSPQEGEPAQLSQHMFPIGTHNQGSPLEMYDTKKLKENMSWPSMINVKTQKDTMEKVSVQMSTKKKDELGPRLVFVNVWNTVAGVPVLAGQKVFLKWPPEHRSPKSTMKTMI